MDLMSLSKQMLKDAVTKGIIQLETGDYRELTTSQILSIARYIVKEGLLIQEEVSTQPTSIPYEMFTGPKLVNPSPDLFNLIPITPLDEEDSCIIETPEWKEDLAPLYIEEESEDEMS